MASDPLLVRLESEAFPTDNVRVRRLDGKEAISRPFDFELEIVCTSAEGLDVDQVLGGDATIVLERSGIVERRIRGLVVEVDDGLAVASGVHSYRLRLAPRIHRMTLVETQEIHVNIGVPEIVKNKLDLVGLGGEVVLNLRDRYPARDFVVQVKETDLAFVSRLLEHLGIAYFIDQQGERDRIVFTDHASGFGSLESSEGIRFRPVTEGADIVSLSSTKKLVPSLYAVRDYNYRTPSVNLFGSHEAKGGIGGVDEFGSHTKTPEESAELARVRAEEREAANVFFTGKSHAPALAAGLRFRLLDHPSVEGELLVVEVEHHIVQTVDVGQTAGEPYRNRFRVVDATRSYRPPRITPRPVMAGLYTGVTEKEPAGGEKYAQIDTQGRYLVRLLFDTAAANDKRASHPIRMSQPHAGVDSGMHFPLHPGVEVAVGFVNGDPDRPVILGTLYNHAMPNIVTSAERTTNRIKTASGIVIDLLDGH